MLADRASCSRSSSRSVRIDHIEKLQAYHSIGSVQAYIIIHQRERRVERHWRHADGSWHFEMDTSGSVAIPCIRLDLALHAIYARGVDR